MVGRHVVAASKQTCCYVDYSFGPEWRHIIASRDENYTCVKNHKSALQVLAMQVYAR